MLYAWNDTRCERVYLRVSVSIAPREEAVIRQTNGWARLACLWCWLGVEESQKPKILATGLHLAGLFQGMVWILRGVLAHSPALTRIIYLKRETKQGGMLSCAQCSNSVQCEKAIVENLNQFFFAAEQFSEIAFGRQEKTKNRWKQRCWEQDMQIVSTLLGIVLLSWHKKNNDSFLRHFSEVAKSSKSSIIKL